MFKRIVSLFLIALILVLPFSITASASSSSSIGILLELLQAVYVSNSKSEEVAQMTSDEFYNFIVESDSIDSLSWKTLLSLIENPGLTGPVSFFVSDLVDESLENMKNAKYNAIKLQEDAIKNIYNQATKINTSNLRFFSFDDLGLSSHSSFENSITYVGYNCLPNIGTHWDNTTKKNLDGLFTYSSNSTNYVQYYNGSSMAFPVFYVSSSAVLYQNGTLLPSSKWYVPLGSDMLICISTSNDPGINPYTYSGDEYVGLTLGFLTNTRNETSSIYKNGEIIGKINSEEFPGWEVADLLSKMVGFCITTDGDPNAGVIAPPSDIPYDDDGYVYVCIPEDKSDVIYLSPTTYNDYVNNGLIVEGDYVSNVTDETVNNITNNITNIYEGSSYDDTNLLNKLEGWFSELYKKIDNLADSMEPSNVINNVYNTYINPPPVYETFSDCFYDNVPAAAEAKQLFNDLCSVTETDLDIDTDVPSDGTVTDETLDLSYKIAFYNPFSETKKTDEYEIINFDWYAPYREDIRNLLKISAYVMGFCAILSAIKSVFGIHGGGE